MHSISTSGITTPNPMPMPPQPEPAAQFMGALAATGYFFPLLKATEVICGALLLSNKYVPLALVILAPIMVNILFFHLFLAPGPGLAMPLVLTLDMLWLAKTHKASFAGVLAVKPE